MFDFQLYLNHQTEFKAGTLYIEEKVFWSNVYPVSEFPAENAKEIHVRLEYTVYTYRNSSYYT